MNENFHISQDSNTHPDSFAGLDPHCVLDALHAAGFLCDGRLLALNSYENRVYQLGMESGAPVVVKFYRPKRWSDAQILEEHAFVTELANAEIAVVPALPGANGETLYHYAGFRFAVFPSQGGRAPELGLPETLESLGRCIGRIHAVGSHAAYQTRPVLNVQNFGRVSVQFLKQNRFIPTDLLPAYDAVTQLIFDGVERCFERAGEYSELRLHGDCHLGNVLWTDPAPQTDGEQVLSHLACGPHFVDFDDSRMGPAIQDLWMLLSGSRTEMTLQLSDLVAGYEDFFSFHPRQLHLIEALRSLRLLHYSAWLAQRWDDPAFKQAFPWFNTQQYWQNRILELREQLALMDEPPLMI